jgi:class 3 adenylate cyclase
VNLIQLIKSSFQYQLPSDLEEEYQIRTYEWLDRSFKIGLPLLSLGVWAFYLWMRKHQSDATLLPFAIGAQLFFILGMISINTKGQARKLASLLTPIYPVAYVATLMGFHVPALEAIDLMIQSQGWLIWVVMLIYAVERISPIMATTSAVLTIATFLFFRAKIPALQPVQTYQFFSQLTAAFVFGLFLCTDNCRRARQQFKLKIELEAQKKISDDLLKNVLPVSVFEELQSGASTVAHHYSHVSVLFADLVDFTKKAQSMESAALVKLLDELFSRFDRLADRLGVEKIKTIGDAYMAAVGCPEPQADHALKIAQFAIDLDEVVERFNRDLNTNFKLKIGISSGSVTAGVIGKKRIAFDLWGDVVNLASRLESVAGSGNILVSEATAELLRGHFQLSDLKVIDLKGKGPTRAFHLLRTAREEQHPERASLQKTA